ncbi:MFS transporter [Alteromonadaceae bacterium BrNp21-10]|nr:MFS transporter [Alteromonadaceae bacterium BrNp21-10]
MSAHTHQPATSSVSFNQRLLLGFGFFAMYFANQSVSILAVPFYQMTLGVDPFLLSLALTIPIIVSTFLSPWVGHLSDQCRSRYGRRRPFIFVASWLSCLLFGLIWMVPSNWSEFWQLSYFAVLSLLFYIAVVFMSVPLTCLSYELSSDHHERTEIMGFTTYFIKLGSMLYQWLFPLAQLAIFSSVFIGMQFVGWGVAVFIIGLMGMLPALFSKEPTQPTIQQMLKPRVGLIVSLMTLRHNRSFQLLLLLTFLQLGGGAFTASMDYYLLVYFMFDGDIATGSVYKAVLSMAFAIVGLLSIPLIASWSSRLGKIQALRIIYWLTALGGVLKWFLFTPNMPWLIVFDALSCTAVWTAMTMLIPSMIADVCDEDELHHHQRREGLFVGSHNWVVNISMAFALLASGLSLNLIGFDAELGALQSGTSLLNMRLILSLGTVIFALLSVYCLRFYGLDSKQSRRIRQQLDNRYQNGRQKAQDDSNNAMLKV